MGITPSLVFASHCHGASRSSRYHLMGSVTRNPRPKWDSLIYPGGMNTPGKEPFPTPLQAPCPRLCGVLCLYGRTAASIRQLCVLCTALQRLAPIPSSRSVWKNTCDCTKWGREMPEKITVLQLSIWKWEVFVSRRQKTTEYSGDFSFC